MNDVELHFGSATDVGRVREVNEDSCLARPPVFVVADGMGGHEGGDVASRIVVEGLAQLSGTAFGPDDGARRVVTALEECQSEIRAWSHEHGSAEEPFYAGTTAVVALVVEDSSGPQWLLANVGDSRAYTMLDGRLEQVSVDHSVVQELVDAGAISESDAEQHPERHVITRALGSTEAAAPDFFLLPLTSVDRVLLCSDGVSGMLDHGALRDALAAADDAQGAAEHVVAAAVEAGGEDNATAVVVDVVG